MVTPTTSNRISRRPSRKVIPDWKCISRYEHRQSADQPIRRARHSSTYLRTWNQESRVDSRLRDGDARGEFAGTAAGHSCREPGLPRYSTLGLAGIIGLGCIAEFPKAPLSLGPRRLRYPIRITCQM